MNISKINEKPVVIGGMGGSGTRVVAQILIELGYYMGGKLNHANDNLWFTLLFKRPKWYKSKVIRNVQNITLGLQLFSELMTNQIRWNASKILFVSRVIIDIFLGKHTIVPCGKAINILKSILSAQNSLTSVCWGWKEPNSHIFLPYLIDFFPNISYIHVIRHGMDMAFSRNQQQVRNWGWLYGIDFLSDGYNMPRASLDYWIRSTERVINLGSSLLGDRFMIVKLEELCKMPESEIRRLLQFLQIYQLDGDKQSTLAGLPQMPKSVGRYKAKGLQYFSDSQIEGVRKFGYQV